MLDHVLFAPHGVPLLALTRIAVHIDEAKIDAAREELFARRPAGSDGFRSGYLLGVEDPTPFPKARALLTALDRQVSHPEGLRWNAKFSLSFLKGHLGTPPASTEGVYFEGPHLDSHPDLTEGRELLRILINLADVPRRFRYFAVDSFALVSQGLELGKREFKPLTLPPDIPAHDVEIPARSGGYLYAFRFWASVVPHVGINLAEGSFLASFEAVADFAGLAPHDPPEPLDPRFDPRVPPAGG